MVEPTTVRKLLDTIELRLGRLQRLSRVSLDEYVREPTIQDQVERNFEVCIQACIDLGAHILADIPAAQPDTYADVFRLLAQHEIISEDLGRTLQRMAGFRNLLVHGYVNLIASMVHANLGRLDDIRTYVEQIAPYLQQQGAL